MTRRKQLIDTIQSLSLDEGTRQPKAADWLAAQDEQARHRREKNPGQEAGHDYQDNVPGLDERRSGCRPS